METQQETESQTPTPAAGITQPVPTLEPETVVAQLRTMRDQIGEVTPLNAAERKQLRRRGNTSNPILQASISVISSFDRVSQAVAVPADGVQRLYDEANRWTAVENELRAMLNGVAGANLVRRDRIALIAGQAITIGTELARDPANAVLKPHVEEVKRLRKIARRKKSAAVPQAPAPSPAPQNPGSPKP
jgi:hypothetical protein